MKNEVKIDILVSKIAKDDELNIEVPVYQNGDKKKLRTINGISFMIKAIKGWLDTDELKTLHKRDSIVNDKLKELTSERNKEVNNEIKNIINRRLFARDDPKKLSEEVILEKTMSTREEIREFNRLLIEGEFKKNLQYKNREGKIITLRSWALCDKDYKIGDPWFIVPEDEKIYFEEHRHFPLRLDNNNSKLGKHWLYIAFELAWVCSGEAHGGCQCPEYCYARRMENTYKNVRDRVLRSMNAWKHTSMKEKIEFYTDWCKKHNGIRFCDTGDVTNQRLLEEIFELVREVSNNLRKESIDPDGKFYIYSTRADLDWSNKPWELVLNASNEELYEKVPDANWFKVIESFDDIPEEFLDPMTLHICNCNCKACDYCAVCRNQVIWEILG